MSSYTFTSITGRTVVEAHIDGNAIYGSGGSAFPSLTIPMQLDLYHPYDQGGFAIELRELRCRLALNATGYLTAAISVPVRGRVTAENQALKNQFVNMEIPFGHDRLDLLERNRKGGDLQFRLDFELLVDELVEMGKTKEAYPKSIWGFKERHTLGLQAPCVIPRSVWVDRVLPQAGYGKILLIELPVVPVESCMGLKDAYDALQQAQTLYKQGFCDEAVGRCRLALEPFFEMTTVGSGSDTRRVPTLKQSWETRLGKATYDWLNASFTAIKEPMNKPHHSPTSYFDRLDAQLLMAVATALIAYAVQTHAEISTP